MALAILKRIFFFSLIRQADPGKESAKEFRGPKGAPAWYRIRTRVLLFLLPSSCRTVPLCLASLCNL